MSNLDFYSFLTILSLIIIGLISLSVWYWSGRRPIKHMNRI